MLSEAMTPVELRLAKNEDCLRIYQWRNDPKIRIHSFNSKEIDYKDHQVWFEKTLLNKAVILLIAQSVTGEGIGTLRFDLLEDTAVVSIYLAPDFIGKGYGNKVLAVGQNFLKAHYPNIKKLQAKILPENTRSKKCFLNAGYVQEMEIYSKELL